METQPKTNEMTIDTAIANYALLRTLPPMTKICVLNKRMTLETRWFSSTRRYLTGDSRKDLDNILHETFLQVYCSKTFPVMEIYDTIEATKKTLTQLYPEIETLFDSIRVSISEKEHLEEDTESKESKEEIRDEFGGSNLRRRIPLDVRIDMDEVRDTYDNNNTCVIYEIFPCLRHVVKWFRETFSSLN